MPAKKPAPKSAKGKKAATLRPAAKKPAAAARRPQAEQRSRDVERAKVASAHAHKTAAAPARAHAPAEDAATTTPTNTEATIEMRKAAHSTSQTTPAAKPPAASSRDDIHVQPAVTSGPGSADQDEVEGAEPGSLLAGPRNVQPYIVQARRTVHEQGTARALPPDPQQLEARSDGRSRPHGLAHEGRGG